MKLIMRTEFDNLRLNDDYSYTSDSNGDKQVVKLYAGETLIAKKITQKKSIRYFGAPGYENYLTPEDNVS